MRLNVGTVRVLSEGALFAAIAACGYGLIAQAGGPGAPGAPTACVPHFVAAYLVTLLSFAAFARSRRTDLVKIVIMVAALVEIALPLAGRAFSLADLAADAAGAVAVLVPSFMERFRSLVRTAPDEPFAMVYPNDRRRRRSSRTAPAQRIKATA